ncbi:MAG: YbgC/FadM family acyl-CoA thioesterase [Alphaproteobacteria bacterium]
MSDASTHDFAGSIEGGVHRLPVRVYFEDTDSAGMVYHANYLHFMERARTEILRACGVSLSATIDAPGPESMRYAVSRCEIDYLQQSKLDDMLEVRTVSRGVGAAYFDVSQDIFRGDTPVTRGDIRVVCLNENGLPKRQPRDLVARLKDLLPVTPKEKA